MVYNNKEGIQESQGRLFQIAIYIQYKTIRKDLKIYEFKILIICLNHFWKVGFGMAQSVDFSLEYAVSIFPV